MSKQTGLGDRLFVGGFNLSGDIGSLGAIGGGPSPGEVTGIDKSAKERLGLLRDGRIEFNSWFNPAASQEHDVLSALPRTDVLVSYWRGTLVGGAAASCLAKQVNYDPTRGEDGSLEWTIAAQANGFGLEWGEQLTAGARTDAAPTNGASIDNGASSAFGLQFYVQVLGGSATLANIELHQSSDNGGGDPFALIPGMQVALSGGTLSPATHRLAATGSIERYLRVVTGGAFTSIQFAAMVVRNPVATVF